jgi:toxin YoeB
MDSLSFTKEAWEQYMAWQMTDRKTVAKINALIKDIQRNGFMKGIGKPEVLKTQKAYSRRIDEYNRLVYEADANQNLRVISCEGHYED